MNKEKRNWQEMRMEILLTATPLSGLGGFYEILFDLLDSTGASWA